jgi:hypothetical protein
MINHIMENEAIKSSGQSETAEQLKAKYENIQPMNI